MSKKYRNYSPAWLVIYDHEGYLALALEERGLSEEDVLLMGIAERNALLDSIESGRLQELEELNRELDAELWEEVL